MAKAKHDAVESHYDAHGKLTLAGMRHAIAQGGSVSFNKRIISTVEGLPTPEELAETPEDLKVADEDLDEEIKRLQARKAAIAERSKPKPADKSDKK